MDRRLFEAARAAPGFLVDDEGLALHDAGLEAAGRGPLLEIGGYCGRSSVYLGAAARARSTVLFSIDHHRGSEEHQPGEGYFDPRFVDDDGRVDTLPAWRATIAGAGLEDVVVGIVADARTANRHWATPLGLVFIDGSHSAHAAHTDYDDWARHLVGGGLLAIHDVFPDPAEGGRPPFEIYRRALGSGMFAEHAGVGSLRVLERVEGH